MSEEDSYIVSSTKELNVVKLCESNKEFILFPHLSNAVVNI